MKGEKENLKMTHSCILAKGKEKVVRVTFEGDNSFAEGLLPSGEIEKQHGFSEDEIQQLEIYLKLNKEEIMNQAKAITGIKHWF